VPNTELRGLVGFFTATPWEALCSLNFAFIRDGR